MAQLLEQPLSMAPARGRLIYENPLASPADLDGFVVEGRADATIQDGTLRLASVLDPSLGQAANYLYWCPQNLPADVWIEWDFWPESERGLCMFFFSARGRRGEDLFEPSLPQRTGEYRQYNRGEIDAFHVSYYRRRAERATLNLCNLRKSHGFHLVASAPDPIPPAHRATPPYHLRLLKAGAQVACWINDLPVLYFQDDGETHGPFLGGGKLGFRQMAPMIARYANLRVYEADPAAKLDWLAELTPRGDDEA